MGIYGGSDELAAKAAGKAGDAASAWQVSDCAQVTDLLVRLLLQVMS